MGTLYLDTGGANTNSGSSDQNTPDLSGNAATVAGNVVTLDGSPNLSGLQTSGPNQASIYLDQATNANRKIFWITAFDNTAKTVTVDVAPTGVTSSAWAIGGRILTPVHAEAALSAGHTLIVNNSPAPHSGSPWFTARAGGTALDGFVSIKGKAGVRPVINVTDTNHVIHANGQSILWIENLELDQDGASGNAINNINNATVVYNVRVSDAGTHGIVLAANAYGVKIVGCEISGCGQIGISAGNSGLLAYGNSIHDVGSVGIHSTTTSNGVVLAFCIVFGTASHGIHFQGAPSNPGNNVAVLFNTIFGAGGDGLRFEDADYSPTIIGNIIKDCGNAGGEYNLNMVNGQLERVAFHAWNIFNQTGGAAGNLNNASLNQVLGTEFSSDPLFVDAAGDNFAIGSASPGKAAAFPGTFLGGTSIGFLDIGALQREEPAGGGGGDTGGLTRFNTGFN